MSERLLKIEEIALAVGVSVKTVNFWYMFKRQNPENEYAQLLPDYIQLGNRGQRFWTEEAIWKMIEFKKQVPKGCRGVMGGTTHANKSTKEKTNGKKKVRGRKDNSSRKSRVKTSTTR